MAIDWTKLDKQDDNLKKRLKQFDRGAKTSGKAEATRSTPTADAAKTLLSSGVNPVAPLAPAAQSARTVTTLPVIQTLPTVADRRAAREDAAAQKSIVLLPTAAEKKAAREDSYAQGTMLDASGNLEARKLADAKAQRRLDAAQYNLNRRSRMAPYDPETERDWAAMGERAMQEEPTTPFARLNNGAASFGQTFAAAPVVMLDTAKQYLANNEEEAGNPERQAASRRLAQVENQLKYTVNQYNPAYPALVEERDRLRAMLEETKVDTPVSQDSTGSQMMLHALQTKEDALQGMEGAPRWLAEQGLSIGQNAALLPLGLINPALPLAAMGTIAAADKTFELNQRGVAPGEALVRGLAAGGIEAATEKIPLDNLMDLIKTGGKSALKNLLKQAGVEAGEESLSYVMNYIADKAARDPEAEFSLSELASSAGGGAFSGLVFGGFGTAANRLRQPVSTLPMVERTVQGLPGSPFESAQAVQTQPVNTDPIQTMNAAPAGAVEAAGQNKTASTGETGKINPGARPTIRETVGSMPSAEYQVPHISMPAEALVDEDGSQVTESKIPSAIRKYMNRLFRGKVLSVGRDHKVYIDRGGIREFTFPAQRFSGELKTAKMTAGANLNSTLEPAVFLLNTVDDGHHPEATGGWDNFYVMFQTETGKYSGVVKTKVTDRGRVFHDITEIQKEGDPSTHGVNGINPPPARTGSPEAGLTDGSNGINDTGTYQASPTSSAPIIADTSAKGNTQYAQNSGGQAFDDGVGAANAGFAGDYNRLQNQSERFHPEGEKAARPVDVPVEDFQGRSIPKSAATVLEAGATPDSAVEVIEQAIANGEFSFDRITDEAAQKRARQTVESKGWDAARESFHQQAAGGKAGKHTMALGQLLLNNAMNAGDSRAVIDILTDYATLSTQSAQAMQAQRMLKKLSPEGQLYGIQRSVENLRGELAERYGDKAPDLNIDEALVDQFLQAQDQAGRDAALDAIRKNIADQIPSTPMDKFNALRYLRMLGNLKTQAKNLTGNATMLGLRTVKDRVAAGIEFVVSGASKGKYQKMKAFVYDPALFKAAWNDYKEVRSAALGEQKYSSRNGRFPKEIDEKRTIFKNNGDWGTLPTSSRAAKAARKATDVLWTGLEGYRKATNAAMEYGDLLFSRINYADAMGQYLAAHGVIADQMERGAVDAGLLDDARAYAIREAQQATFRDNNAVSGAIAKMGGVFRNPKNAAEAIGNASAQGTAPFLKTPANVVVRMEEYSPLGLINTLVNGGRLALGSKSVTGADIVDSLAKSLTGTGLFALGAALYNAGRLVGGPDDDDEQEELNLLTGGQNYAYVDAEGNSSTLEWLSPAAGPMFMGVEFAKLAGERGYDIWAVLEAAKSITNPMLEMSMMQGINSQLESISYSDDPLTDLMLNSLVSYLTQGLTSTLGGQIERTSEDLRMTTFRDKTAAMPTDVQQRLGKLSAKLPGFDFQQIPYIDGWGRTESNGTLLPRAVENFLAPWYSSQKNATEADKEIQRLLRAGQSGVVPKRTPQSVEVTYKENPKDAENQKRYLNAEEYVSYATVKGQTSYDLAMDMINSDEYRSMTDEQKAEALKLAYAYAGHVAAEEVTDGKHESEAYVALAQAAKKELGLSEAEYLLLYEQYRGELNKDKVREAYRQGMDPETYLEYASGKSSYNSDGEGGLTIAETAKSIRESGLTKDQQELLWLVSYPEWSEKADKAGVPISDYIAYKAATAGLKKSAEKKAALIDAGLPTSLYDKIG
ncbi:hypothetical protein [Lawsonibacter hominis]|uniref:Uncharacterized protein n=1 Tax=Lawsonibacter hominis TaxID=2763053 RepID=A0A8J6MB46_9FIRM|nr:hypothetical protein [Lawsonibacter hominis]MBC5735140.1 hypothetical protein [Lawsonibacter hominis]